jgi:uncharacterized protein
MRHLMMILAVVAGTYLGVCLLAFAFQKHLVFYPERRITATPASAGMTYRDVFFKTDDGVLVHGWFVPASGTPWVLLYCHGNAGNVSNRVESIRVFHDLGISVFIFDYRGYGRSGGEPSEAGTYTDARAAYRELVEKEGVARQNVIFYGRSLGGPVAIELAAESAPAALIVESSFPTLADAAVHAYPFLPVRPLLRIRYDSTKRITAISCPKLFVHSRGDEVVPFDAGTRLFEMAAPPKQFLEIQGDHNHGFLESGTEYTQGIARFLDSLERNPG